MTIACVYGYCLLAMDIYTRVIMIVVIHYG
jgi:hypothetical protein